ncbi:MAG: hypothetical protein IPK13_07880 [Deltaproteobacteria bacterium]|nr:hypothetical protein [Deltaproteobacteria bacterium]
MSLGLGACRRRGWLRPLSNGITLAIADIFMALPPKEREEILKALAPKIGL